VDISSTDPECESMDYLCLLDESESDAAATDRFFVFGGMLVPSGKVNDLHDGIVEIREAAQLPPRIPLKWHMDKLTGVSQLAIDSAKSRVPALAAACEAELFASPVLRQIALEKKRRGEAYIFGANTILKAVGEVLSERRGRACFLVDRFPLGWDRAFKFLGDKMASGVGKSGAKPETHTSVGFGFIDATTTRVASVLDVCLGLFTKCLNEVGSAPWIESGRASCALLSKNRSGQVFERGLLPRPIYRLPEYHAPYARMWDRLRALGVKV
jgi:hypothetical protein